MTTGIVQTESKHPGGFMVSEANGYASRDKFAVALSQTLVAGQVCGKTAVIASTTASATADASNTGNGVMTLDVTTPVLAGAKDGVYRVVNDLIAANSGQFIVFDPDGIEIGRVAVAGTFASQIKFVIADGATDFAIGDAFSVNVGIEETDYQVVAYNLTGTDGSQRIASISFGNVTTDGSNLGAGTFITRGPTEVRGVDLVWPAGITAPQLASGIRALEKLGIIVR
jgi:hypothetical protein